MRCLRYALHYTPRNHIYIIKDSTPCDKAFKRFSPSQSGADICISISRAYLMKQLPDSSLYYLELAGSEYLPYRDCGNGMGMYLTYLSLFFADVYLAKGDTANAINKLLDYMQSGDGDTRPVIAKLKKVLLYKYTQRQIAAIIQQGIANIKIVHGKALEPERVVEFTIFGHTIRKNARAATLGQWKQIIAAWESIHQLLMPGIPAPPQDNNWPTW